MNFKNFTAIFILFAAFLSAQTSLDINIPKSLNANAVYTLITTIKKGNVSSFSKYQLDVPENVQIEGINLQGGHFTFENRRAKIVWVECPTSTEFEVQLRMKVLNATGEGSFEHRFYYIEGNMKKEISDSPVYVDFLPADPNASNSLSKYKSPNPVEEKKAPAITNTVIPTPTNTVTPIANTTKTVEPKKTDFQIPPSPTVAPSSSTVTTTITQTTSSNTTPISLPEIKSYKVQIGSFSTRPSMSKFTGIGQVSIKEENKIFKVYVGNYTDKNEAISKMEELKQKGYSGFVVTFINGEKAK